MFNHMNIYCIMHHYLLLLSGILRLLQVRGVLQTVFQRDAVVGCAVFRRGQTITTQQALWDTRYAAATPSSRFSIFYALILAQWLPAALSAGLTNTQTTPQTEECGVIIPLSVPRRSLRASPLGPGAVDEASERVRSGSRPSSTKFLSQARGMHGGVDTVQVLQFTAAPTSPHAFTRTDNNTLTRVQFAGRWSLFLIRLTQEGEKVRRGGRNKKCTSWPGNVS